MVDQTSSPALFSGRGLVRVDEAEGFYNAETSCLTLNARGKMPPTTHGFKFGRLIFLDGLAFSLTAWNGPGFPEDVPYSHNQSFYIPQGPYIPGNKFHLRTSNHPNPEKLCTIYVGGLERPGSGEAEETSNVNQLSLINSASEEQSSSRQELESQKNISAPTKIHAILGTSFDIKEKVVDDVNIRYDEDFLDLKSSGTTRGNIFWKFRVIQAGRIQVIVSWPSDTGFVRDILYDVFISEINASPQTMLNGHVDQLVGTYIIINSFYPFISDGIKKVRETHPSAELYSVRCDTPPIQFQPTTLWDGLSYVMLTCRTESTLSQ